MQSVDQTTTEHYFQGRCVCFLCGIILDATRRVRRTDEPAELGIRRRTYHGYFGGLWWKWAGGCAADSGCMSVFHYDAMLDYFRSPEGSCAAQQARFLSSSISPEMKDMAGSALDADNLDYASIGASASEYIRVISSHGRPERILHIGRREFWFKNNMPVFIQQRLEECGFRFPVKAGRGAFGNLGGNPFEHVSGPGCTVIQSSPLVGINGRRISHQEMLANNIAQAIHHNPDLPTEQVCRRITTAEDWETDPSTQWRLSELQSFPSSPRYYTTAARRGMWVRPTGAPYDLSPVSREMAMPFHPTCLEVYKRAAIHRHGSFDVNKLGNWFVATSEITPEDFPRHHAVQRSSSGGGLKLSDGDEWLIANPCYINGLADVFQDCARRSHLEMVETELKAEECRSRAVDNEMPISEDAVEDFSPPYLPFDCWILILDRLNVSAIINLSAAFPQLISGVCYHLQLRVKKEMPFLWELWCERPYSGWTSMTLLPIQDFFIRSCEGLRRMSRDESPGMDIERSVINAYDSMNQYVRFGKFPEGSGMPPQPALVLNRDQCTKAAFIWMVGAMRQLLQEDKLKGLRNRQRIWRDCELILDQIEMLEAHKGSDWDAFCKLESEESCRMVSDDVKALLYGYRSRR